MSVPKAPADRPDSGYDLKARDGGKPIVHLTETYYDDDGYYAVEWYCAPPAPAQTHKVTRDEWWYDYTVRRIFEWVSA